MQLIIQLAIFVVLAGIFRVSGQLDLCQDWVEQLLCFLVLFLISIGISLHLRPTIKWYFMGEKKRAEKIQKFCSYVNKIQDEFHKGKSRAQVEKMISTGKLKPE